jgi:hypothetical protein
MKTASVILVIGLAGCDHDAGRGRGQGTEGAGNGTIAQRGAEGVGQAPPVPQVARSASGSRGSQTAECVVTWESGSAICKNQGTESGCGTRYQGPYATLAEAKNDCETTYGVGKGSGAESCGSCRWVSGESRDPAKE